MNDLVVQWSRNELDFGGREHIQVLDLVPYLDQDELVFIIAQPISDAVRESAAKELQMRLAIKSPWRDIGIFLSVAAIIISICSWVFPRSPPGDQRAIQTTQPYSAVPSL